MVDVFRFSSYRGYLKEYYRIEKASSRRVDLAILARAFDMSPSGLNLVLSGKRNLTIQGIHKIARALKFSLSEKEYFESLVLSEQADEPEIKSYYARRCKKITAKNRMTRVRTSDKKLLSTWCLPALLVHLIDVERVAEASPSQIDVAGLATRFKLPEQQVQALLEKFNEARLLKIKPEDQIHFVFSKVADKQPEKVFIKEVLQESIQRVEQSYGSAESFYFTAALSIPVDKISSFREDLKSVIEAHMNNSESTPTEDLRVLQTSVQFFSC